MKKPWQITPRDVLKAEKELLAFEVQAKKLQLEIQQVKYGIRKRRSLIAIGKAIVNEEWPKARVEDYEARDSTNKETVAQEFVLLIREGKPWCSRVDVLRELEKRGCVFVGKDKVNSLSIALAKTKKIHGIIFDKEEGRFRFEKASEASSP